MDALENIEDRTPEEAKFGPESGINLWNFSARTHNYADLKQGNMGCSALLTRLDLYNSELALATSPV
jgi:hypothetical protein